MSDSHRSNDGFYVGDRVEDPTGDIGFIVAMWNPGNTKYQVCCVKWDDDQDHYEMVPENKLTRVDG